jgi:hypothetical protein
MSTAAYEKIAKNVVKTLKKKGQTMYLCRTTGGTYDSATQQKTGATEVEEAVFGVEFPLPPAERMNSPQSTKVVRKAVYLEAISPTVNPSAYDALKIGAVRYKITACDTLSPGGLAVLHELRVQAGG